jgi:hypothetical protein
MQRKVSIFCHIVIRVQGKIMTEKQQTDLLKMWHNENIGE